MVPRPGTIVIASLAAIAATAASAFALQIGTGANRPPKIEISLPDRSSLYAGEKLRFTVTITDPDGDPVDARLVKGLGRMTMRKVSHEHSPAKRSIECWPQPFDAGRQRIVIEANDTVNPARKVRKAVVVDVGNFNYASSSVVIDDVDGDGRFELLATSRGATHDRIAGAGVVYRFDQLGASGLPVRTPSVRYYSTSKTTVDFGGDAGQSVLPWDFTGDGRSELTIAATFEDNQLGRIFSFDPTIAHGTPPPLATLSDPAGKPGDQFGRSWSARGMFVGDVTGDGIDDLVVACSSRAGNGGGTSVAAAGGVFVFAGGSGWSGAMSPTATLVAPLQHAGDQLSAGASNEDAIFLEDVTGDGIKDVVVVASAYTTTSYGEGAIFVWKGGASLVRKPAPLATLSVANASSGDFLGGFGFSQGVRIADVTGDGIADVVAGSSRADDGTKKDTGALYVWAGGAGLTGNPAPTATLRDSASYGYEMVGDLGYADSLFLLDLSGDGILDIVTASYQAAGGGVGGAGQLYVWNGGATLSGTLDPTAKLYANGARAWDHLAYDTPQRYPTIRFADVSGDGRLDVIASAPQSDASGAKDSGAVYVWNGRAGGFAGATPSDAELTLANPRRADMLGQFGDGPGFEFADLNGDRQLDIVVGSKHRGVGTKDDVGSASLFLGGPGLSGSKNPDAELVNSHGAPGDFLVSTLADFADVDADGITDAIFLSPAAKSPPFGHTGAGFVWFGGPGLVGARDPDVELRAPRAVGTSVVGSSAFAADLQLADLTGDGVDDVLIGSPDADVGSVVDAGGWWIFAGGRAMSGTPAPVAELVVPGASAADHLGDAFFQHEIRLIDLDQDGALDVLASASDADTTAAVDAGALYLWRGPFAGGAGGVITFVENGPTTSYLLGW